MSVTCQRGDIAVYRLSSSRENKFTIISNYTADTQGISILCTLKELGLLPDYTADSGERLTADLGHVRRELERETATTTFYWRLLVSCGCSASEREVSWRRGDVTGRYLMLVGDKPLRECELHRKCQAHFKAMQDAALFERLVKAMEVVSTGLPISAKVRQLHQQFASSGKEEGLSQSDRVEMLKQATTHKALERVLAVRRGEEGEE